MPNFTIPPTHFDPTFRERVRDANSIEQIINDDLAAAGHHPLVGTGEELEGWHPAHGSTSGQSLKVNIAKQVYICFNCGEAGDVFTWVMHAHSYTFVEALHFLATRAGISLPSLDPTQQQHWQQLQEERHNLEALFREAVEFFHQQLMQEHVDFCKGQWGLTLETIQQYKLGFAPAVPDALQQWLRSQHFADDLIRKSGLVINVAGRWFDFFQGRIIFPYWRDLPNDLLRIPGTPSYFIGRRLKGTTPDVVWEQAKYRKQLVHSPKHSYVSPTVTNVHFYGEHSLRGLKNRPVLLTEGVTDCLVALQADMPTISPATVRFSKTCYSRLLQLARHAQRIIICNDNEDNQAGTKGALATAAFLDNEGVDVRLVTLPRPAGVSKVDLADFLQNHPAEDLQRLCDQAVTYLDARLATYTAGADGFANCQTARQFLTKMLCQCPDEQKALAFLRYRVKEYFSLRKPDIDDLVTIYHTLRKPFAPLAPLSSLNGLQLTTGPHVPSSQHGVPTGKSGQYLLYPYGMYMESDKVDPHTGDPMLIPLTNFGAQITGEVTRDDGSGELRKSFEIAATVKKQAVQCSVPAKDYSSMSWVAQELGAEAILAAGSRLKDCTREAIQRCSEDIVHRYVYEHTGWRVVAGERCYLHNGGAITAQGAREDISVELSGSLARFHLPQPPAGPARVTAVQASLDLQSLLPDGGMIPVQGTVYLAPLRELLATEAPDFTLWMHGRSGLFKSELAALAQAHWGDFSRMTLPASFVATGNALERLTFATKDALLVCDDYFPARNKREADAMDQTAARLLRGVGNGSGRSRMRQDTSLRADLPPRGVTLATGERLPDGLSTNARLFLLYLTPTAEHDIARRLTEAQERKEQYSLAMSAYIQWIAQHWDTLQATLPKRFRELRQMAYAPGSHSRQASQVAYLQLAWEAFTGFAVEVRALGAATQTGLLQEAWGMLTTTARQQSHSLQDEAPERRFLALLADGFASKRAYLENRDGDCPADGDSWGWVHVTVRDQDGNEDVILRRPSQGILLGHVDESWLYLFPDQAYQFVAKATRDANSVFPVELNTLLKHLADSKLIATTIEAGQVRRTLQVRIGTGKPRVIKLRRTAVTDLSPKIQGTSTLQEAEQGTEQFTDFPGVYGETTTSVPYVPWIWGLESHIHKNTPIYIDSNANINSVHDVRIYEALNISGDIGDIGDIYTQNSTNTEESFVPWNEEATGATGATGDIIASIALGDWCYLLSADGVQQNATPYQVNAIVSGPDGQLYARFAETSTGWPLAQCERTAQPTPEPLTSEVSHGYIPITPPPPEILPASSVYGSGASNWLGASGHAAKCPECGCRKWMHGVTSRICENCGYKDGKSPAEILEEIERKPL